MLENGLDIIRALSPIRPPGRPRKYVSDDDLVLYKEAGWSNRTIAVSMGVSRATINRRVIELVKEGRIKPEEYNYNFNNPSATMQPRRTDKERWEYWHGPGV